MQILPPASAVHSSARFGVRDDRSAGRERRVRLIAEDAVVETDLF